MELETMASTRRHRYDEQVYEAVRAGQSVDDISAGLGIDRDSVTESIKRVTAGAKDISDPVAARRYELLRLSAVEDGVYNAARSGDSYAAQTLSGISDRRMRLLSAVSSDGAIMSVTEALDAAIAEHPLPATSRPLLAATRSLCQRLDWANAYGDMSDTATVQRLVEAISRNCDRLGLNPDKPKAKTAKDNAKDNPALALLKYASQTGEKAA